jgi:hypothetical protein
MEDKRGIGYGNSETLDCWDEEMKSEIINENKILLEGPKKNNHPKYLNFEKVTTLMTYEQKKLIDYCADRFMENRIPNENSERITANTIIRCLIKILNKNQNEINFSNIHNENELFLELENLIK